ncbi:hypothetical protein V492_04738 [Pseudogymnoascus sp. VKM F-4246]|nr:hypothetical protein V492_04738 [Pseudogymnoascus sp. VKM F-4246]
MAAQNEPEIVLYDLACTKNVCFSPTVWRIRLILNYKQIPYRTVFLEFPDIEPTLKGLGIVPGESPTGEKQKYTVPAIHHVPTNTHIMDSTPIAKFLVTTSPQQYQSTTQTDAGTGIAKFLVTTYPTPPLPLTSELGRIIEVQARSVVGPTFRASVLPREINILSPRSQEYFRRTREAALGHRLEDLLDDEEQSWKAVSEGMKVVGELLRTNAAEGPFVLGAQPSYTDFFIAGSLQTARMVDEAVFQRHMEYAGYKEVYEACLPYMARNV